MIRALALCAAVFAAPAQAFVAQNNMTVRSQGDATFYVPYAGRAGTAAFWCAAGDYVVRELGRSNATRIYRISKGFRSSGEGMTFSLSPEGAGKSGLLILSRDQGVSAGHARMLCDAAGARY